MGQSLESRNGREEVAVAGPRHGDQHGEGRPGRDRAEAGRRLGSRPELNMFLFH